MTNHSNQTKLKSISSHSKQTKPKSTSASFNSTKLKRELKIDARAIGIPSGAAETFIDLSLAAAAKSLAQKSIITENDLKRAIYKELKKYHTDLAYVYKNRDKII